MTRVFTPKLTRDVVDAEMRLPMVSVATAVVSKVVPAARFSVPVVKEPPNPTAKVPTLISVIPVVLAPDSVSVVPTLPDLTKVPDPVIDPVKRDPAEEVTVKVFDPRVTVPEPKRSPIDAPDVELLISNVPLSVTGAVLSDPLPDNAKIAEALIVVVPV